MCVGHDVKSVFGLNNARVFCPTFVFPATLLVEQGKHRPRQAVEVDAIVTLCQTDARGVIAKTHLSRVIFSAIQDADSTISYDGGRVE